MLGFPWRTQLFIQELPEEPLYVTEDGKVVDLSKNYLTDSEGNLILDSEGNAITL
jgi:hypothetical protein